VHLSTKKIITIMRFIVVRHMDLEDVIKNEMYMHLEVMFFYTKTFFVRYAVGFDTKMSFHIIFFIEDLGRWPFRI